MKRPLVFALVFLICGIFLEGFGSGLIFAPLFFIFCTLLFFKYKTFLVYIFILLYGLGSFSTYKSLNIKDDFSEEFLSNTVQVEGNVHDVSITSTNRFSLKLKAQKVIYNDTEYKIDTFIQVLLDEGQTVENGQDVILSGKILPLEGKRNEGGFNEELYLKARKIQYKMFAKVLDKGEVNKTLKGLAQDFGNKISKIYDICLPEEESAIIKAMIIGDKSGLSEEYKSLYRISGAYHILAISGLHIGILYMFINYMLRLIFTRKIGGIITLIILFLYCILTGSGVPTVRAVTMCSIIIVGDIIYRKHDTLTSVSFAALCLLIYEPLYLWDIGFQYSFSAVYSIVLTTRYFERFLLLISFKIDVLQFVFNNSFVKKSLPPSLSAFLGTLPVAIFHFYYLMPYSVITNLLVIPTVSILVIFGFSVGIIGLISLPLATFLCGPIYALLKVYENIFIIIGNLPFSQVLVGSVSLLTVLLFYLLIFMFTFCLERYNEKYKYRNHLFIFILIIFISTLSYKKIFTYPEINMLDVGQGDCVVISKNGKTIIVDGGGTNSEVGRNTGVNVLVPYLNYNGINYVDIAFITHTDSDHMIGILELLQLKKVGKIVMPDSDCNEGFFYDLLLELVYKNNVEIDYLSKGDKIQIGDITIDVLSPDRKYLYGDTNDDGLVFNVSIDEFNILFTADVSKDVLEKIARESDIKATVYKVAHHGSKFSASSVFLDKVDPSVAIVSSGENNRYSHPHKEAVELLEEYKISLYNTAYSGEIKLKFKKGKIELTTLK